MRRTRLALAAALAGLTLSACGTTTGTSSAGGDGGSGDAGGSTGGDLADRGEVDTILFDYPFTSLPVYGAIRGIIEQRAAEAGVTVEFTNDESDLQKQVSQLNTYLSSDVDAVVSFPTDPASLESIAAQYREAGKYWVTYGGDMENQDASLKFSFYDSGRMLGEDAAAWAIENVGEDAEVIVLTETERQIGQERTKGLLEGLEEVGPDLQIVGQQQAVTPDDALSATTTLLSQHPDASVVVTVVGDAAQGAYQALVAAGRAEDDAKTYVGGLDPNLFGLQKMSEGKFFRAATYFPLAELVRNVVDVPLALGQGEQDASVDLPVQLVTAEDPKLDQYIAELGG